MRSYAFAAALLAWAAVPARAADLPFKVLSAGKVRGQVEAGVTEVRDAKTLARELAGVLD